MKQRILITSFTFPPQRNGVSHVVASHAAGLANLGYDVAVVTGGDASRAIADAPAGVRVFEFDTSGSARRFRGGGYHGDIQGYQKFIATYDADAIICHCWQIWSTDLAAQVFVRQPAKKILVSHGVNCTHVEPTLRSLYNWVAWRRYVKQMPHMLRQFDRLVVLSGMLDLDWFYDHQLSHKLGLDHVSVIPNGADAGRFTAKASKAHEFRRRFGLGESKIVLNVGNYDCRKNQEGAVRAFGSAQAANATLVLIGNEINDYARHVQSLCRRFGLDGRVLMLERQAQEIIASAYCAADLFICPSRWELQPLVLIDAMAAGVAWLSTDVGCVREIPGGVVVPIGQFPDEIRRILGNEAMRTQLAARGAEASRNVYCWDAVIRQYDHLLQRVLGGPPDREVHSAQR